jgi:4-carboxymuconolactone decarboxylase
MRSSEPRIQPMNDEEFTDELWRSTKLTDECYNLNIIRTFGRATEALVPFLTWTGYIMSANNSLSPRSRELVILRIGHLCQCRYELAQHRRISLAVGLLPEEIERTTQGASADWEDADATLIKACDELVEDHCISDSVWRQLRAVYSERQAMDIVMTAGQYVQVAMMLNSFGVQLESGMDVNEPWKV